MNSLKNLVIIAILAAVGYGVYQSLIRNNAEPAPPGVAPVWPTAPKVELPSAVASRPVGGPLALSAPPAQAAVTLPAANTTAYPTSPAAAMPATIPPLSPPPLSPPADQTSGPGAVPPLAVPPIATPAIADTSNSRNATPPSNTVQLPSSPAAPPEAQLQPPDTVRNLTPPREVFGSPAGITPPLAAVPADGLLQSKFADFMAEVQKKLDEKKFVEAHFALSMLYGNPDLPPEQAKQVTRLLDQLAGTVIYSRQHYLDPPYLTQQGDTLEKVAQKYSVPWQLLARINGLMPPEAAFDDQVTKDQPLPLGMQLKIVRGPFDAVVHLDKRELTLVVHDRYAGRFSIGLGTQPNLEGDYTVRDKMLHPAYRAPNGAAVAPGDPGNPLGAAWIGLGDNVGIHGTADPYAVGRDGNPGAICLGQRDLEDLYGILSVGSRVTIMR
jgi:hypothetical protein